MDKPCQHPARPIRGYVPSLRICRQMPENFSRAEVKDMRHLTRHRLKSGGRFPYGRIGLPVNGEEALRPAGPASPALPISRSPAGQTRSQRALRPSSQIRPAGRNTLPATVRPLPVALRKQPARERIPSGSPSGTLHPSTTRSLALLISFFQQLIPEPNQLAGRPICRLNQPGLRMGVM